MGPVCSSNCPLSSKSLRKKEAIARKPTVQVVAETEIGGSQDKEEQLRVLSSPNCLPRRGSVFPNGKLANREMILTLHLP
jgi:hypothetical protein